MRLLLDLPLAPMLAKAVPEVPAADTVPAGYAYEPKWDGFRCLVLRDGAQIELASRGKKPLTRYFPEVVAFLADVLPRRCALDAEIVVPRRTPDGLARLDWESLSQRIHPAASRIATLSVATPAQLVAFDLLALDEEALLDLPFGERRARLEALFAGLPAGRGLHLTRLTHDADVAREWFERFEGAGLDGVMAKDLGAPYTPGKRTMLKIKHKRTAEAVLLGYRVHTSGTGVGSLLLGLYDDSGTLHAVGGISAFTAARRRELVDELAPLVVRDEHGAPAVGQSDRSRFSGNKDTAYVPLRPERVVEVAFDQLEGARFRHAVQFLRWRPDRDPASATLAQIDRAPAYDLSAVLSG